MKLTYFNIDGGRAEAVRVAFYGGDIAFKDNRIGFEQFGKVRGSLPFGAVPVLEIDDKIISQSVAITKYAGRLSGFYPEDQMEQLYCDEVLSIIENATQIFAPSMREKDPTKTKLMREELEGGYLSSFIKGLSKTLNNRGGKYFSDNRLTVADFAVYAWINWQKSGMIDHVSKTLIDELAPNLIAYHQKIAKEDPIFSYYKMRADSKV